MAIPGQNLAKLSYCVTSQVKLVTVKFPNFLAKPPSPMNMAIPGQNLSSLGLP